MARRPALIVSAVTVTALGGLGAIALNAQPDPVAAPAVPAADVKSLATPEPITEVRTVTIHRTKHVKAKVKAPAAASAPPSGRSRAVVVPAQSAVASPVVVRTAAPAAPAVRTSGSGSGRASGDDDHERGEDDERGDDDSFGDDGSSESGDD